MTHRRHLTAVVLTSAALFTAALPAAAAAGSPRQTPGSASAAVQARRPAAQPAKSKLGTVKGKIKAAHPLKSVVVTLYVPKTAQDGSKGWVVSEDVLASGGHGVTLNKKTGDYSFNVKPGTYRVEFYGEYRSGKEWGNVAYGPDKPAGPPFGKSIKVRKGKATKHISIKAAGDFGTVPQPDPGPSLSPTVPTAGGTETVVLGTWPKGTAFTYTWQLGSSEKFLSLKRTIKVPASAAGKAISVDIYAFVYGKNGAAVSISTIVAH